MTLPYESATSGEGALQEIQRILTKFGRQRFGTAVDAEHGVTNRAVPMARPLGIAGSILDRLRRGLRRSQPRKRRSRVSAAEQEQRFLQQAQVSVCSVLRDWCKAQVTAIECGVLTFEAAFLPHMLLESGERVIDRIRADHLLPANLLPAQEAP